ncbi:MAG: MFS transporter [Thermomicrobiales bacterium]
MNPEIAPDPKQKPSPPASAAEANNRAGAKFLAASPGTGVGPAPGHDARSVAASVAAVPPPLLLYDALDAEDALDREQSAPVPAADWTPTRRGTVSWVIFGVGNTVFQQAMSTNYFPIWVVAVMGGSESQISLVNTLTMGLMLAVGPWIGAVSDRLPRRVPLLMITVLACCLLTFFVGGSLSASLALFFAANLLFQSGLVLYDALLPAVSTQENRGRVGGIGGGLSNLGALGAIALGFFILHNGGIYHTIFQATAVIFVLLAIPLFLWAKEPPRAVAQIPLDKILTGAVRDLADTAQRARDYPDLVRFLVGRAFYAEAASTIGIFLGVYLIIQVGFNSEQKDLLLLAGLSAAMVGGIFWGFVVDRIGARDSLLRVLAIWSVVMVLIAATGFHILPQGALWPLAPLAGFSLGGIWAADRPLMVGLAPPQYLGQFYGLYALAGRFAALAGPLLWALIVDVLGWGRPVALLALTALVLVAMVILRPLSPDIGRTVSENA